MTTWIIERTLFSHEGDNEKMTEEGWEPFAVEGAYVYWRKAS